MSDAYFEKIRTLFTDKVPHCRAMGMRATRVMYGTAEVEMPYRPFFMGNVERGRIHGSVITTLIDTVSGMVACTVIDESERVVTLDLRVDYLRPAQSGRALFAEAECYRLARSIAFIKARVWQDGEPSTVATGQSAFARLAGVPGGSEPSGNELSPE